MTPRNAVRVLVAPTVSPVSLAEAKAHLEEYGSEKDGKIASYLLEATQYLESYTGRAFATQTLVMTFDAFPSDREFDLPICPAQSVTSIQYVDPAGATQTFASGNYILDDATPARIALQAGAEWPATAERIKAVTVTYVAGHSTASPLPEPLRRAILLLVGHFSENREAVVVGQSPAELPMGVEPLAHKFRVF
jgi:uncharacterized phiE125 gp8 family phage protein